MVRHLLTKIIRFDDRYDFTKGLVPLSILENYEKNTSAKMKNLRSSIKQQNVFVRALSASVCPFYGGHA
jgi:hypothetical protein